MSVLLRHVLVLLAAQSSQATITGTVRDGGSGQPLAGVAVALPDLFLSAVTDAAGRYTIHQVPAGPQHLVIESIGYEARTLHALVPRSGTLEVNISLQPRPIALRRVDVRTRIPVRGSGDRGRADRWIPASAVSHHPLLAEPDGFLSLTGGEVVSKPETAEGLFIRGGASDQTAWLLDGIPVFNPYHAAGEFSAWNIDALARLDLHAAAPPPSLPDVLSGTVTASTRPAGRRVSGRGTLSTAQASMTLDGPAGETGAGWLFSVRTGFPAALAPRERSYLGGSTSDWLAKIEAPLLGGTGALLAYGNDNAFDADAGGNATAGAGRNRFAWSSRSFGARWTRALGSASLGLKAWSAATTAGSGWQLESGVVELGSRRRDEGVAATIEFRGAAVTSAGLRVERSRTEYGVQSSGAARPLSQLDATTPVASAFVEYSGPAGRRFVVEAGAALTASTGGLYPTPRVRVSWLSADRLTVSASLARSYQFVQSMRNAESVVGSIFPADLFVGTGAEGVPIGRSDTGVLSAELRPAPGWRIMTQAYSRGFDGLLLMSPSDGEPFATHGFAAGTGVARGVSIDASMSGARFGLVGSWGWRRVRYSRGLTGYTPAHGTAHNVEAGVVVFPGPTSSFRLGVSAMLGRRTTPIPGTIEWESCNLLDQGCEFAGSPHYGDASPGSVALPRYVRLDLGLRRHWHVSAFGRDATVALSGTVTNLLARSNLLTWATDPATGQPTGIEMRPRAPLVIGFDWSF